MSYMMNRRVKSLFSACSHRSFKPRQLDPGSQQTMSSVVLSKPPADLTDWILDLTSRSPIISSEELDARRAGQLLRTLPTRQATRIQPLGEILNEGHHLIYFQPETRLSDLGEDGSSTQYNPPAPFLRRMWAGGSMEFRSPLKIGETITQRVTVPTIEWKKGMVFVNQQRELYDHSATSHEDWSLREIRTHVFRRDADFRSPSMNRSPKSIPPTTPADLTFEYTPSSPLLFLFSALTHNAHKIHYDRSWTKEIEGHPDLLVHAPLTALLLLELAGRGGQVRKFEYRATSPTYANTETVLTGRWTAEGDNGTQLALTSQQEGRIGMTASAYMT